MKGDDRDIKIDKDGGSSGEKRTEKRHQNSNLDLCDLGKENGMWLVLVSESGPPVL